MTKQNKELDRRGQQAAARFLYRRGYDILEVGYSCDAGSSDIVAKDDDTLVFVDVATRTNEKGFPAESVSETQRESHESVALNFLASYDETDVTVRFDVISIVVLAPDRALVRHHINALSVA